MRKPDNDAFPTSKEIYGGLTIREIYVMNLLQGILANPNCGESHPVILTKAIMLADLAIEKLNEGL